MTIAYFWKQKCLSAYPIFYEGHEKKYSFGFDKSCKCLILRLQFDMSYCLLPVVHSPGIPIRNTSKYCYCYPPPSPNPKIFWSEYEVQHKLNQFVQQNIEGFYWTSHVYRMYKETFQIKAGLKRNTSKGELWSYRSNKRKEERREPRHRLVTGQQTVVLI